VHPVDSTHGEFCRRIAIGAQLRVHAVVRPMKAHNIPPGWREANHCETVKRFNCCNEVYSLDQWDNLPCVGTMDTNDPDGPPLLELRNCPKCDSTHAISVSENMLPLMELRRP
jgi:hypothetical protein